MPKQVMRKCVPPKKVEEDRNDHVCPAVNHGCDSPVGTTQVSREYRSRKRHSSNSQQQKQVKNEQAIIGAANVVEQTVMVDPHDADEGEAQNKSKIRWPLL